MLNKAAVQFVLLLNLSYEELNLQNKKLLVKLRNSIAKYCLEVIVEVHSGSTSMKQSNSKQSI